MTTNAAVKYERHLVRFADLLPGDLLAAYGRSAVVSVNVTETNGNRYAHVRFTRPGIEREFVSTQHAASRILVLRLPAGAVR